MAKTQQKAEIVRPQGIVLTGRKPILLPLELHADYSHLFANSEDWSRVEDLAINYLSKMGVKSYLGGSTVGAWLWRGQSGRDTDLLAVVPSDEVPNWFIKIVKAGRENSSKNRIVQVGGYGYGVQGLGRRRYMNIEPGVEIVKLRPIKTLYEHSKGVTLKTIDLSLTSESNFRRCYKNLNTMRSEE